MPVVLTKQQYDELAAIDSATIANAIEPFKVRDDTTGFVGRDVTCLFPEMGVTLGYAVTATAIALSHVNPVIAPSRNAYGKL